MTDFLTFAESEATRQLVNLGYVHAAKSFSAIARQPVAIETTRMSVSCSFDFSVIHSFESGRLMVLTTDLIGDLPGKSLLIFSENDCQELFRVCLADKYPADKSVELENAILLEIDNMLAAAVITQFANALNVRIYGGVPRLQQTDRDGLFAELAEQNQLAGSEPCYYFFSNARFTLENNSQLHPQFIWILPESFLHAIQRMMKSEEKHP